VFGLLFLAGTATAQRYLLSTVAGGGLPVNIPATSASLALPADVVADGNGNVYLVVSWSNVVLRMDAATSLVTVVAGNGMAGFSGDGGPATSAQLDNPTGIALDSSGNLYIADTDNSRIRMVSDGVITTVAGGDEIGFSGDNGPATDAQLFLPHAVAVDAAGNLYINDLGNNRIRMVSNGVITTVAGNGTAGFNGDNGPATSAELNFPEGIAVDGVGNLYIADQDNHRVRKISNGVITTVAGNGTAGFSGDNGPATKAELNYPPTVAVDSSGNLYIADQYNNRIREVSNGVISTVAGNGNGGFNGDAGPAVGAELFYPYGVSVDGAGDLYIADEYNNRIRKVSGGTIYTVAGGNLSFGDDGPPTSALLGMPRSVATDLVGNLYIADSLLNRVRLVSGGVITTIAGTGIAGSSGFGVPASGDGGPATSANLSNPGSVAQDSLGNLYIADAERIRVVSNGVISTVAGNGSGGFSGDNGPAVEASLNGPSGIALDVAGNLYIADYFNHRIRMVSNGMITTVAGNGTPGFSGDGGPATNAWLNYPYGVALDREGNLYIADSSNNRIRMVSNGVITTVAGNGLAAFSGDGGQAIGASLSSPGGVAVDSSGNLYIADSGDNRIRMVSNGVITTIAGGVDCLGDHCAANNAQLSWPLGITVNSSGEVYIADTHDDRIRVLKRQIPEACLPRLRCMARN